jgi:ATP-dependent helicase/nuclease subunit A
MRAGRASFVFYAGFLGAMATPRLSEIGPEAGDAIDEFLRPAISHEAAGRFARGLLDDLTGLDYSIKRDMEEQGGDRATIHATRGLEAKSRFSRYLPRAVATPQSRSCARHEGAGEQTIAWSPRKDLDCEVIAATRKAATATDEYRRYSVA